MKNPKRWASLARKIYAAQWIIAREDETLNTEVWHWMYLSTLEIR